MALVTLLKNAIFLHIITTTSSKIMTNKHIVEVENVMPCPENDLLESPMRNVHFLRINRTHKSLSYDVTLRRPLDENIGVTAMVEKWGNAGWVAMPFMPFQPDLCHTMLLMFRELWVTYNRALGVEHPDECPIPAGNYSMKNYLMDMSSTDSMPFWKGKLRFKTLMQTTDTRKTLFCSLHLLNSKEIL